MACFFFASDATWASFIALCRLFYLSDSRPTRPPPSFVLSQVISAPLQITLPPVWGSDPSQGSPLNLILIITSVINRQGLGGDYSTRPVSLFPLSTRRSFRPWAVIPVSIRRKANTQVCSFKDLATLQKNWNKKKGLPLFPCEWCLICSGRPQSPLPTLPRSSES